MKIIAIYGTSKSPPTFMAVRIFEISLEFIVDSREMSMPIYENDMRDIFTLNGRELPVVEPRTSSQPWCLKVVHLRF